jgi:peptidoglycan/LPS O-acetylase OafA/YrhL
MFAGWLPWKLTLAEVAAAALYVYPGLLILKGDDAFLVHLWTLSVEEWFYFLWPAFLIFVGIRPNTARRLRLVVGILLGLVALAFLLRVRGGDDGLSRLIYAFRPDSLAWGALLAVFMRKLPDIRFPSMDRVLVAAGLIGCVGWVYFDLLAVYPRPAALAAPELDSKYHDVAWGSWNYQLGIICCVLVIMHQVNRSTGVISKVLSWRPFVRVGQLSYALYLWHQPVFLLAEQHWYRQHEQFMPTWGGDSGVASWYDDHRVVIGQWVFAVVVGVVSLVLAQLSWKLIEVPALRLKRRFEVVRPEREVAVAPS